MLDSTTVPFTIGARIKQKITLAEATITNVQNLTAGVTLTINDITGTFASSNDLVSSKTTGTLTVASTTNFGVGDNITGGILLMLLLQLLQ